MNTSDDNYVMPESNTRDSVRSKFSRAMQVMLLTASLLLLGVGMMSTSWATPAQDAPATIPTRTPTPEPLTMTLGVTLERPNAPAPSAPWAVPVQLAFYQPGDPLTLTLQSTVTLNASGYWTGTLNLFPGNYDVRVRNLHTLRNVKRNVPVAAGTTINMGTLREGDADGDNRVRISDFTILRNAYFTNAGDPAFDSRADFDEDQRIRISDFSLLRSNYFANGDIEVTAAASQAALAQPQGVVAMALEPAQMMVQSADIFWFTIVAHAGAQPFVGLDTTLQFPVSHLQIVGPDGQPATQIEALPGLESLYNRVDNAQGTINYSAGTLGDPVSGDLPIARVRFKAVGGAARLPIDFGEVLVSDPAGQWVTGPVTGAVVVLGEPRQVVYLPLVLSAAR